MLILQITLISSPERRTQIAAPLVRMHLALRQPASSRCKCGGLPS
jgi:hypothetical protein